MPIGIALPLALLGGDASQAAVSAAAESAISPQAAFTQAFTLTFVSEIGDKTFFIAAILAAGSAEGGVSPKVLTFVGAIGALVVMTFLAVAIGQVFHAVPDVAGGIPLDDYIAIAAFGYFGIKLLLDANAMDDDSSLLDERDEAEEAIKAGSGPSGGSIGGAATLILPPIVVQAFLLVFAAEIGDRSFLSAIALSASGGPEGAVSVFSGGIAAHAVATLIAVVLGEVISSYITEKQITYVGGVLFLFFAAETAANVFGLL